MAPMKAATRQAFRTEYRFRDRMLTVSRGSPLPLGAVKMPNGVNFALVCRHGTAVWLVLSEPCDGARSTPRSRSTPSTIAPATTGTSGSTACRRNSATATGSTGPGTTATGSIPGTSCSTPTRGRSRAAGPGGLSGDLPRRSLMNESMIERDGASIPGSRWKTRSSTSCTSAATRSIPPRASAIPGTFAGLAEKIDYLKWLGITAVELLPVDEFDENDCPFVNPLTGERLKNYWGYNPIAFGAPKAAYAINPERSEPWDEFCEHGRRVPSPRASRSILDIVFNHTAEGGEDGPTYNFRGLDNSPLLHARRARPLPEFQRLRQHVQQRPPGRPQLPARLPAELGRRGGRRRLPVRPGLGLRPRPARQRAGRIRRSINRISEDSLLYDTKLIAEPWDAAGLYQVGTFPGEGRWSDWNGRYRDDVRRFWRGEPGMTSALATRICGSDDLYAGRGPLHSINFICCHDGFTLNDLVSYNQKHNEANGEGNRDGNDANWSWNCGAEGPTDDPGGQPAARAAGPQPDGHAAGLAGRADDPGRRRVPPHPERQQQRLVPGQRHELGRLVAAGSERRLPPVRPDDDRPPEGASASCGAGLSSPAARRAAARRSSGTASSRPSPTSRRRASRSPSPSTAAVCDRPGLIDRDIYVAMNSVTEPLDFKIPASPSGRPWRRVVDTALPSPTTSSRTAVGPRIPVLDRIRCADHSMIILVSEP